MVDSSFCFKHYYAEGPVGLRVGNNVTIWRASLAAEEDGVIEIGDDCYIANASLVCSKRITIGSRVLIAGGVTIADSDFHPMAPAMRVADTIALSLVGDRHHRPSVEAQPVIIEDDVWIGLNAVVLQGVTIGRGAIIGAGAVVNRSIPAWSIAVGVPARVVGRRPGAPDTDTGSATQLA